MIATRTICVAVVVVLALLHDSSSEAGSPAPHPLLGTLKNVHLSIGTDLGFDPIPALDRTALQQIIRDRTQEVLEGAQLQVAEPVDAYVSVTVDHAWDGAQRDKVALLVSVQVHVVAEPRDPASRPLMNGRTTMTIWSKELLELAPTAEVKGTILEALDSALANFIEDRRSAQMAAACPLPRSLTSTGRPDEVPENSER